MITPMFQVGQDDNFVTVVVEAKYAKISETEVYYDQYDFKFYSKPYYLRLTFPGPVKSVDESECSISYDCETGKFTIKIAKSNKGEDFQDLDLTSKLLAVPKRNEISPNIEIIADSKDETSLDDDDFDSFDWHIEQEIRENALLPKNYYGFANKKSGCLDKVLEEISDLIDLKSPDQKTNEQRIKERLTNEIEDFSVDHYLADLYDCDEIEEIINFLPFWEKKDVKIEFTESEQFTLKELPRREYLLTSNELRLVGLSLVDLIYCYAYQHRTTFSEPSVESGWTIRKLSPTLSWLESHSSLKSTLVSVIRRSLIYPLYRNWDLTKKVVEDLKKIFSQGRKCILKCLLEIRSIFINSDSQHVLNELYVIDYCVWIQKTKKDFIKSLARSLLEIDITKSEVGLELDELELIGKEIELDEMDNEKENSNDVKEICDNLKELHLVNEKSREVLQPIKEETLEEKGEAAADKGDEAATDESSDSEASVDYYLDSDDSENEK